MKKREIRFGRKVLQLPCFFASVSSVKTNFSPKDYVEFLEEFGFPSYLVSAYDIINFKYGSDRLSNVQLCSKEERDSFVLLDSGNYEAYWLRDHKWNSSSYNKALETVDPDSSLAIIDSQVLKFMRKKGIAVNNPGYIRVNVQIPVGVKVINISSQL